MIFTQFSESFFCASHKSERTRILYFSRTNSYFQGDFTKFKDNSRTKGTFFKFQEFSKTKVKFKNFSRSVRALSPVCTFLGEVSKNLDFGNFKLSPMCRKHNDSVQQPVSVRVFYRYNLSFCKL